MRAFRTDSKQGEVSRLVWTVVLLICGGSTAIHAQPYWPQFRGPSGCGVADAAHPPLRFDGTNGLLWRTEVAPGHSSPCIWGDRIFLTSIRDGGLLQCLKAADGSLLYQQRVGVTGGYSASPIGADGRVYLASQSGTIVVLDGNSNELKVLTRNSVGGQITATPAFAKNCLYVRTDRHLAAYGTP